MENKNFDYLLSLYLKGDLSREKNIIKGTLSPPLKEDIKKSPLLGTKDYEHILKVGQNAIDNKEVGALILAGGMATRFASNRPKGIFPIFHSKTFLQLKAEDCRKWHVPLYIMTSFYSHELINSLFKKNEFFGIPHFNVSLFQQYKLPRIYKDGTIVTDKNGKIDYATSGHGDFIFALKESGLLAQFLEQGGKYLFFSNVDNLGATINPAIIGHHILSQKNMTVELALKRRGDKGGAPVLINDRIQLLEGFSFPKNFNQDSILVFNTATYIFTGNILKESFDLPWYIVEKKVKDKNIIQFERIAGDLTKFIDANYLEVERDDRFLPVKTLDDVSYVRQILQEKLLYN